MFLSTDNFREVIEGGLKIAVFFPRWRQFGFPKRLCLFTEQPCQMSDDIALRNSHQRKPQNFLEETLLFNNIKEKPVRA